MRLNLSISPKEWIIPSFNTWEQELTGLSRNLTTLGDLLGIRDSSARNHQHFLLKTSRKETQQDSNPR